MNVKGINLVTLFAAGTVIAGAPTLGARTLDLGGSATAAAGGCGAKEPAKDGAQAKEGKCGAKDAKAAGKKGAAKGKEGKCGAKKDGSCGKDKKDPAPASPK